MTSEQYIIIINTYKLDTTVVVVRRGDTGGSFPSPLCPVASFQIV